MTSLTTSNESLSKMTTAELEKQAKYVGIIVYCLANSSDAAYSSSSEASKSVEGKRALNVAAKELRLTV